LLFKERWNAGEPMAILQVAFGFKSKDVVKDLARRLKRYGWDIKTRFHRTGKNGIRTKSGRDYQSAARELGLLRSDSIPPVRLTDKDGKHIGWMDAKTRQRRPV
jgi:hypothetical protein